MKTLGLAAGLPQYPNWEQVKGFVKSSAKLVWHGHADQVVDLAKESIRDIAQLPPFPAPKDRLRLASEASSRSDHRKLFV